MTNQEAITKLTNIMHDDHYAWHPSILEAFRMAVDALRGADGDCISRAAAIDALGERPMVWMDSDYEIAQRNQYDMDKLAIETVPSAQPEIIHCGDCRYKDDGIDEYGTPFLKCLHGRSYGGTRINDFCSWAERKEGEADG